MAPDEAPGAVAPSEREQAMDMIADIARELGIGVEIEPIHRRVGCLIFPDGRRSYFRGLSLDLNGLASSHLARDKGWALHFLRELGYTVPRGDAFYSAELRRRIASTKDVDAAWAFARQLGMPVIVKPNSKSEGVGVALVATKRDFYRAMRVIFGSIHDDVALVEEVVEGRDYRIVVVDREVVSAYERRPFAIVGDGRATVAELVAARQRELELTARHAPGITDYRVQMFLRRQRIPADAVLPAGRLVRVLQNANLSTGGDAVDVTDRLGSDLQHLSIEIVARMGLRLAGVDMLIRQEVDQPLRPGTVTVLELNSSPGLDNYAFAGARQYELVRAIYRKLVLALQSGPDNGLGHARESSIDTGKPGPAGDVPVRLTL
jgi:D-alanine-D-alanine ligase-like ATP-grasp enzyme